MYSVGKKTGAVESKHGVHNKVGGIIPVQGINLVYMSSCYIEDDNYIVQPGR